MEPILQVKDLTHTYGAGTPFQRSAVEHMSFDVNEGEFLGIIGHTGSGKSTLIQHLNGLLQPTAGEILLRGKNIWAEPKKIREVRFKVGLVFQYPEYQLFEETVYKDIAFGPANQGKTGDELDHAVREAAKLVGIRDDQLEKSPFELSGGQKRRVALAGVLAMEPEVLVLDEPTAGLDPAGRENLMANIQGLSPQQGKNHYFGEPQHGRDRPERGSHSGAEKRPCADAGDACGGVRQGRGAALRRSGRAADHPDRYGIEASGRGHRPGCLYGGGAGASAPCPAEGGSGMLKDITLGQYFPGNSIAHKLDPRTKILLVTLYIIALFSAKGWMGYAVMAVTLAACVKVSHVGLRALVRGLKPLVFIIAFTGILNMFFTPDTHYLWEWGILRVSVKGIENALFMVIRIMLLVMGTFLMTYTTSPIRLTDGLESLLNPLKKIHVPVHELAMMMAIALRFIPTLIEETDKIMSAQKARGADFDSGNIFQKAKALVPILVPLFISAFRRADELATAMECRCYHGGEGRTKLHVLKYQRRDYVALAGGAVILALVVVLRRLGT